MDWSAALAMNETERRQFLLQRGVESDSLTGEEQLGLLVSFLDTDEVENSPAAAEEAAPHTGTDDSAVEAEGDGTWHATGDEGLDEGLSLVLDQFCEISGCERNQGKHVLEAVGWELDSALSMYMEGLAEERPRAPPQPPVRNAPLSPPTAPAGAGMPSWNDALGAAYEGGFPSLGGFGFRGRADWMGGGDDDDLLDAGGAGPRID
jgi:hypothetical protein